MSPNPIHVLVVGPAPASSVSRGGMATVVSQMLAASDAPDAPVEFTMVTTHIDVPKLRMRAAGAAGMMRAARIAASGRPDVVHIHLSHGGSVMRKSLPIAAARLRGIPVVVHAHSYNFTAWYERQPRLIRRFTRAALRADRWLILGNDLAAAYTDTLGLDPEKVAVLHNPAPAPIHGGSPDPQEPILGVAFGRLGQRKGTYDVLEAVRSLDPAIQDRIRIVLAGDGEVEQVRSAAADLPCVEVRGWIGPAQRDELLTGATFFLLPSYDEGLPMALMEAMAAGLVPVVTPVGAIGDVVENGQNGFLVAPGDTGAIAGAITEIIENPVATAELATQAGATAKRFGLENWHADLITLWTQLARRD